MELKMTLQDKLAGKRFVITAEVTPPVSFDRAALIAKAAPLKGLADAVNLTDGAGARPHWAPSLPRPF
jgi:methylenetetrahydrofolate reductase (NADPH)